MAISPLAGGTGQLWYRLHTMRGRSITAPAWMEASRLMYSPIAQLSGAMDLVAVPGRCADGVTTSQSGRFVGCVQTCSGMKPSGVENAFSAARYGFPLAPFPVLAIS